jgi:hypothetical protein
LSVHVTTVRQKKPYKGTSTPDAVLPSQSKLLLLPLSYNLQRGMLLLLLLLNLRLRLQLIGWQAWAWPDWWWCGQVLMLLRHVPALVLCGAAPPALPIRPSKPLQAQFMVYHIMLGSDAKDQASIVTWHKSSNRCSQISKGQKDSFGLTLPLHVLRSYSPHSCIASWNAGSVLRQ